MLGALKDDERPIRIFLTRWRWACGESRPRLDSSVEARTSSSSWQLDPIRSTLYYLPSRVAFNALAAAVRVAPAACAHAACARVPQLSERVPGRVGRRVGHYVGRRSGRIGAQGTPTRAAVAAHHGAVVASAAHCERVAGECAARGAVRDGVVRKGSAVGKGSAVRCGAVGKGSADGAMGGRRLGLGRRPGQCWRRGRLLRRRLVCGGGGTGRRRPGRLLFLLLLGGLRGTRVVLSASLGT